MNNIVHFAFYIKVSKSLYEIKAIYYSESIINL